MKHATLFLGAVLALSAFTSPAGANVVPITLNVTNNGVEYYVETLTFDLPTGFTNALLSTTSFVADDSAVAELNGKVFTSTGIGGPGDGNFSFDGTTFAPYTFTGGNGGDTDSVSTGFMAGVNTLSFIVDNTDNGIAGDQFSTGESQVDYAGTLTYDGAVSAAPEAASWAMMIVGFGIVGGVLRRGVRTSHDRAARRIGALVTA